MVYRMARTAVPVALLQNAGVSAKKRCVSWTTVERMQKLQFTTS